MNSAIKSTKQGDFEVKSKSELKRLVTALSPSFKNIRILTDEKDTRSQGNPVAILEQAPNGTLTLLKGAPNLTLAFNFFKAAVEDGRIK